MRDDRGQPWDALLFVLAAGGVALLFVGVGWWFAQQRRRNAAGDALGGLDAGWTLPSPSPSPSHDSLISYRAPRPAPAGERDGQAHVTHYSVGASAVEILGRSRAGSRRVRIACDQPIRIGNGSGIAARPNDAMPLMATDQPFDFGTVPGTQRLFAVAAPGGSTANVTVMEQGV